jgi:competence protein ComEC
MRLDLGGGTTLDILFPDRDVSMWPTNDGSVVAKLSYGNTSIMLTGDATKLTESYVMADYSPAELHSNILKVGHHGSDTSTSAEFLQAVAPATALISVGKDNKYGLPKQDTLDNLLGFGAKILRTDQLGSIIMTSDGNMLSWKYER